MDNRLPKFANAEQTLWKKKIVLLFIPQGKPNYKVFNIEFFMEQLLVEKTI